MTVDLFLMYSPLALTRYACENVNKLLVGNKSDLEAKRAVTTEEAKVSNTFGPREICMSVVVH